MPLTKIQEINLIVAKHEKSFTKTYFNAVTPAIAALLASALYNVADTFFVSRGTGMAGIAGVGMTMPLTMIVIAAAQTIGTGCSIIISHERGRKNSFLSYITAVKGIRMTLIFGAVFIVCAFLLRDVLFNLFGADDAVRIMAKRYLLFLLPGIIPFALSMVMENLSRAMGRNSLAVQSFLVGGILNIILDYIFIIRFQLGIQGAAAATSISQLVCMCFNLIRQFGKNGIFKEEENSNPSKLEQSAAAGILKFGTPVLLHQFSLAAGLFILYMFLKPEASEISLAATGLFYRINFLFTLVHLGILQGMQPLLGFFRGANEIYNLKRTLTMSFFISVIFSLLSFICIIVFSDKIIGFFLPNLALLPEMNKGLRILSVGMLFWPAFMIPGAYYLSDMKPFLSSILNVSRNLLLLLPSLLISTLFFDRFSSLWIGSVTADFITAVIGIYFLRKAYAEIKEEFYER